MGFLDNIKDRLSNLGGNDDYYDDEYYDDEEEYDDEPYDDEEYDDDGSDYSRGGLLGNSRRPEPESVAVYTRSGQHVSGATSTFGEHAVDDMDAYSRPAEPAGGYSRDSYSSSNLIDTDTRVMPRTSSNRLPPYVLRPASYDDVQMVIRRVRTNQPVVLVLHSTNIEAAKRILDFCYGLSVGLGGTVQELGDRVFVVLPAGAELSQSDIDKLVSDGDLVR